MDLHTILSITEIASSIAVLVSIIFLLLQTREAARQTRASVYQSVSEQMIEIDRLFIEFPELKPYFYGNKPLPEQKNAEYYRVMSLAEMLMDFFDNVIAQKPNMPDYPWDSWERYFIDLFNTSPALQEYWRQNRDWYPKEFQVLFDPWMKKK